MRRVKIDVLAQIVSLVSPFDRVQISVNTDDNYNTVHHVQTKLHNHEFSNIPDVEMNCCHHHHQWKEKDQQTMELHDAQYCLTIQMDSPQGK